MFIEDCTRKDIFGSFERGKLPSNLTEYSCQMCIEEYQQGKVAEEIRYFRFTPKAGVKGSAFNVMIDTIVKPKNPIFSYKITEDSQKDTPEVAIGNRVQFKFQTTVKQVVNSDPFIINEPQQDSVDDEFAIRDIDEDNLRPKFKLAQPEVQEDRYDQDSRNVEQAEGESNNMKTQLITFLRGQSNRKSSPAMMKQFLNSRGHRVSEATVKQILKDICDDPEPDKRVGFTLKSNYSRFFEDSIQKNPKKKIKDE